MTKKDILELKKRLNKTDCSITKLCGCYVDSSKNKVLTLSETFLNLDDEEFYKYLDLARSSLNPFSVNALSDNSAPVLTSNGYTMQFPFLILNLKKIL